MGPKVIFLYKSAPPAMRYEEDNHHDLVPVWQGCFFKQSWMEGWLNEFAVDTDVLRAAEQSHTWEITP